MSLTVALKRDVIDLPSLRELHTIDGIHRKSATKVSAVVWDKSHFFSWASQGLCQLTIMLLAAAVESKMVLSKEVYLTKQKKTQSFEVHLFRFLATHSH